MLVTLLITNLPPVITAQPAALTNSAGSNATFAVSAAGAGLFYQWRKNGTNLAAGGSISGVTNATLTFANLAATNAGSYSVVVSNFAGVVTSTVAPLVIFTNAAPPAPSGLAAVPASLRVNLSWDPVAGATGYNLRRGLAGGGPYPALFGGLAAANYSDAGVSNAVKYYYVVSALGAGGESTNSAPVAATPLPSNLPAPLVALPDGNLLRLSWPQDHLGWRLLVQTNDASLGLSSNWAVWVDSTNVNSISLPLGATTGSVFLRLVYP